MATAPIPGVGDRETAAAAAQQVMRLTLFGGPTLDLAPNNLPFDIRQRVRKQTGFPFATFWSDNQIDVDSLQVMWWVARMVNGEDRLTFKKVLAEWPDSFTQDDFEVEVDDGLPDVSEDGEGPSPEG